MFSRRLAQRASSLTPTTTISATAARPFSSTIVSLDKHDKYAKSPALADVTPDNAHIFDQRTQEFRAEVAERIRREREEKESQSASAAKALAEAKQSSSSPNTASSSSAGGLDSQSAAAPSALAGENDPKQKKVGSGPLSKLIYGTEEGRKMDQDIERSFSQVLARGKYVHSIVFHEVKPSKVDEYVELVGNWYPRMANMPENKVNLVGSWRTEVGDCDTFVHIWEYQRYAGYHQSLNAISNHPDVRVDMEEERYETLKELGSGNFGVARLAKDKKTGELVAIKYIERGKKIDANVQREIVNHRSLRHPNIIRFKEVFLTHTHLAIVLEYAAGGELFERICNAGRLSEDEARFFFQQLVSGVSYCHSMQICHRDLKLENTLLDENPAPRLKICDFGFSKSALLHSQPKSTVGTPAYIAPEVLSRKEYDGKIADVWSCGVTLYVMLVGAYPFEDPEDPKNFRKSIGRIMSVQYAIPDYVRVSKECRHLISCIFVANPAKRITMSEIKQHLWFRKNLAREIIEGERRGYEETQKEQPSQSVEEVMKIIDEARTKIHTSEQTSTGSSNVVHGDEANEELNDHFTKYVALQ